MSFDAFRQPILDRFKAVWLTFESYKLLRKQKDLQDKSIQQIVDDLVKERYGQEMVFTAAITPAHEASYVEQTIKSNTNI